MRAVNMSASPTRALLAQIETHFLSEKFDYKSKMSTSRKPVDYNDIGEQSLYQD